MESWQATFILLAFSLACNQAFADNLQSAFSPKQGATDLIVSTIGSAKKTLCMAAYSFTSEPVAQALVEAHERGVDVRVVLDKSQKRFKSKAAKLLLSKGVPTHINKRYAIMHNKFIVIDQSTVQLGSFNYTKAAEIRNAENALVLKDRPELASRYETECSKLWQESQ